MGYTQLEMDNVQEVLRKKPKWLTFIAFASAIFLIATLSSMIGVIIGYYYCYFEYRAGVHPVSELTNPASFEVIRYLDKDNVNRTINGALKNALLISKILRMGHGIIHEEITSPFINTTRLTSAL